MNPQRLADESVNLLCLCRRRRHACTDRPDRLVGDDDVFELLGRNAGEVELRLHGNDLVGDAGEPLFFDFAEAEDDLQAGGKRRLRAQVDGFVGLSEIGAEIVSDSVILWTVTHQAPPLSMEFSRQEYWSVLPFPPPGDLPDPGRESMS